MKKILVVILALVYFVAGSGFLLRNHYCGGEYVATQLDFTSLSQVEWCDSCGMEEEEGGCCESKTTFVKKAFDQQISELQDEVSVPFFLAELLPRFIIPCLSQVRLPKLVALQALQKPPPKTISIFKEICCFRI